MLYDIITLVAIIQAQNDIAARQLLLHLATKYDEDYSRLIVLKAVALGTSPIIHKDWLLGLY